MVKVTEYNPFIALPENTKIIFTRTNFSYYQQVIRLYRGNTLFVEDERGYVTKGMYKS